MAFPSTSTSRAASNAALTNLGGIEALRLKAGPVRRSLFGPVDHEQLEKDFRRLLCMSVEAANERWDFDFDNEKPADGAEMEWEELRCQDVPAFYRTRAVKPARRLLGKWRSSSPSSSGESTQESSSSSGSGDEYLEVTTTGYYRLKRLGKHKQPNITDFFKVKKRRLLNYKGSSRQ